MLPQTPVHIALEKSHQPYFVQENSRWKVVQIGHLSSDRGELLSLFEHDPFLAPQKLGKDCTYLALRKSDNTLFVARDPFGFTPIRYARGRNGWIIWNGPDIPKEIFQRVNYERLAGFIAHRPDRLDEDYFVGVYRILPGHMVSFVEGSTPSESQKKVHRYYQPDTSYSEETIDLLAKSFRRALIRATPDSDLLALSGGLDSSALLSGIKKVKPFTMFSGRFQSADEREEVALLTEHFHLSSTYFNVDDSPLWSNPDQFNDAHYSGYGPIFHPPLFGEQAFFSRMAAEGKGPILTGIGGDNVLDVSTNVVARRLIQTRDVKALRSLAARYPSAVGHQLLTTPARALLPSFIKRRSNFKEDFPWLTYPLKPAEAFSEHWGKARRDRVLSWSWEQVTRLLDSHGRAIGRSILSPWMSSPVWNLLLRLPPEMLFYGEGHKGFLRYAMTGHLPESIRTAGKSKHFGKPVEYQLLRVQKEIFALFHDSQLDAKGLIKADLFSSFFGKQLDHMQKNINRPVATPTMVTWPTIAAEIWLKDRV